MSFDRPTITEIRDRVHGDLRDKLDLKAILRRTFLFAFGTAITGVSHELHGRASYIARQLFVDQMEAQFLDRYGAIYALSRNAATFAELDVLFTGTDGTVIPVNTELFRTDGETYQTKAEVTIQTAVAGVAEVFTIDTVADVSQSLNSTYFEFHTPDNDYYAWFNVDSLGVDPSISTSIGVEVAITENESANDVASLLQAELDLLTDINAVVLANQITVSNVVEGDVSDSTDGSNPTGFTLTVTQQGVDEVTGGEVAGVIIADNSGSTPNTDAGEFLTLTSAIAGVDSDVEITGTVIEGEDQENDENYRTRILDRIRQAPHGGNVNDYIQWAKEVTGVTRAWVFDGPMGAGTVGVAFVEDGETDIFPSAAKIAEVQEYIDARKPVTANVFVYAPVKNELNLTIKISPNTSTVRANVETELRDLIFREAAPNGAIDDPSIGTLYDGTILISKIREAISIATGEDDNEVVSPIANYTVGNGEMAALGTITWQAL